MVIKDLSGTPQGSQKHIWIPRMSQELSLSTETKAFEETKSKFNTNEQGNIRQ